MRPMVPNEPGTGELYFRQLAANQEKDREIAKLRADLTASETRERALRKDCEAVLKLIRPFAFGCTCEPWCLGEGPCLYGQASRLLDALQKHAEETQPK
jgi:hypothetical protein